MCGIAALIAEHPGAMPTPGELGAMAARLRHRGPDDTRVRIDGRVGLAHTRLSIVDLAGGAQPIGNEDDTVRVIFNGEIFNHVELRGELERRGHRFRTRSDTEVLVHLYEELGDALVTRLNGQFAFVLHDTRRARVLVARDRVGIRPVFYVRQGGRIAIASEVKALFALPGVARRLDPAALPEVFGFWSTLGDRTPFEGVRALPPAHTLAIELDARPGEGLAAPVRYWDWRFDADMSWTGSEDEAAEALHALLVDAVRLQLRADVPVGTYLSGGLDSAAITALVAGYSDTPLRTFSLGFQDPQFDEGEHQRALVRHFGTSHSEVRIGRRDIADAFPRMVLHAEAPLVRTSPAPLMLLARHVREQGFKVVLTGEGADEIFGGYDLFKEARLRRFMAAQPDSRWRPGLAARLYPYLATSPVRGGAMAGRFLRVGLEDTSRPVFAHETRIQSTQRVLQFLSPEARAAGAGWSAEAALARLLPEGFAGWAPASRDQYVEAVTLLPGFLLSSQGDRAAMAHSVEGRFPFLDHRVIEFANRLPPRMKLRGLREKRVLKAAMRRDLPAAVLARGKQPYRAPDSACFFEGGRPLDWVADLTDATNVRRSGLFDAAAVGRLVAKCAAGRAIGFPDNMAFVGVLSTLLLQRQLIEAPSDGPLS